MTNTTFLSPRQAARLTGVPCCYIRRLIHENRCPGFQTGAHFRVDVTALLDMIKASYPSATKEV